MENNIEETVNVCTVTLKVQFIYHRTTVSHTKTSRPTSSVRTTLIIGCELVDLLFFSVRASVIEYYDSLRNSHSFIHRGL